MNEIHLLLPTARVQPASSLNEEEERMARPADPNRRADILRAAHDVFIEHGYACTRMSEIARSAGVAPGTLYLYFDSKEGLVQELAEDYFARLKAAVLPILEQEPDVALACSKALHAALEFASANQETIRLLQLDIGMGHKSSTQMPAALRDIQTALARSLALGMESGEVYPYDPQVLAELLIGLVDQTVIACLIRNDGDLTRYEATLLEMLQRAVFRVPMAAPGAQQA
jgi:AcrR family transcriptional regulator